MLRMLLFLVGSGISIFIAYKLQYWLRSVLDPYGAWILASALAFGGYALILFGFAGFNV